MTAEKPTRSPNDDVLASVLSRWRALLVFTVLLWLVVGFLPRFFVSSWSDLGGFGDSFGLVNSFFSCLAFACLFFALVSQRQELQEQRKVLRAQLQELEHQRDEFRKTREEHEASRAVQSAGIEVQLRTREVLAGLVEALKRVADGQQRLIGAQHEAMELSTQTALLSAHANLLAAGFQITASGPDFVSIMRQVVGPIGSYEALAERVGMLIKRIDTHPSNRHEHLTKWP